MITDTTRMYMHLGAGVCVCDALGCTKLFSLSVHHSSNQAQDIILMQNFELGFQQVSAG